MKTPLKFLIVLILAIFIYSCKQECTEKRETMYVDESYLPTLIPYSDTSTRLFLKNGTDTLLFKSQGLVKDFGEDIRYDGNCPVSVALQRFSLKMKANDSDYFNITYVADWQGIPYRIYLFSINRFNNVHKTSYKYNVNVAKTITVLNTNYDSSYSVSDPNFKELFISPKVGPLKIKTTKYTLELIK